MLFYRVERRNYRLALTGVILSLCFLTATAAIAFPTGEWLLVGLAAAVTCPFMLILIFGALIARKRLIQEAMREVERGAVRILQTGNIHGIVICYRGSWHRLKPETLVLLDLLGLLSWCRAVRIIAHNSEISPEMLFQKSYLW